MAVVKQTGKGYFEGLRKRLLKLLFLAFFAPFVCLVIYALIINFSFINAIEKKQKTDERNREILQDTIEVSEGLALETRIVENEAIVAILKLFFDFSGENENAIGDNIKLQKLLKFNGTEKNIRYSIISQRYGQIYLDKQLKSGSPIENNLQYIHKTLQDPQHDNQKGTSWSVFSESETTDKSKPGSSPVIAMVTRITGTNYELALTARINPAVWEEIDHMNKALVEMTKEARFSEEQRGSIISSTLIMLLLALFVGLVLISKAMKAVKKRIIHPADELMETSDAIREGNYFRRVDLSVMTEDLIELGYAINRMLDTTTRLIESEQDKKDLQEHISSLLEIVSQAAEGDLSRRGEIHDDVLGSVVDAFNLMLDSISELVSDVRGSGRRVTVSAVSILDAARKILDDSKRQGKEIHQVTAMVQKSSRSMQRVSISADMANEESQRATIEAKEGARQVNDTIRNMQRIRSNVQATSKTIKMLGDRSLEINAIVEMINDISARTNILSLNAAIEASKAGEQGKGFAVVADEIRKLAERTTNATKDISSFIEDIQIETNDAVLAMEEVTREVELGWKQSDHAGSSLRQIQDVILSAADKIMEISKVSSHMVNQMDSVVEDIKSIYQVTRETSEGISRSTKETRRLLKPLDSLDKSIRSFKLAPNFETDNQMDWIIPSDTMLEEQQENNSETDTVPEEN